MTRDTHISTAEVGGGDDVDKLIAAAKEAAREAQMAAAEGQKQTVSKERHGKAASTARIEKLQQEIAAFRADDAGVEDYAWEWVIGPAVAETGIAAPRDIQKTLIDLRKTGEALRKLADVEPQTEQLLKILTDLKKRHDQLFERMQEAAVDLLDTLKKKYKGEETELIKQLEDLADSPLFRDIKQTEATPEAREKALKQEIVELLLRPAVKQWLEPLEKELEKKKEMKKILSGDKGQEWRRYNEEIPGLETALNYQKLSMGFNQALITETLSNEHDENALREAMVEIKSFLYKADQYMPSSERGAPTLENPLAKKILGEYLIFGADVLIPRERQTAMGTENFGYKDLASPVQQLTPKYSNDSGNYADFYRPRRSLLAKEILLGWGEQRLKEGGHEKNEKMSDKVFQWAIAGDNRIGGALGVLLNESGGDQLLTGKARSLNMRHAYERVKAKLAGEKQEDATWITLPASLKKAGWQESKLHAWVEPDQSERTTDREFAQWLERFSAPHATTAEEFFDKRGADKEFVVETMGQSMDLLRRVRGTVRDVLERAARVTTEAEEEKTGVQKKIEKVRGDVAGETGALRKEAADLRSQNNSLETRLTATTHEANQWRVKHDRVASDSKDTQRELRAANQKSVELIQGLEAALRIKPGFLGGDKELRARLQEIIDKSKGE